MKQIPRHAPSADCPYMNNGGGCYYCCTKCAYDRHICHFCGESLTHDSYAIVKGEPIRHWLSNCRPDLVKHDPGEFCTWAYRSGPRNCYAYQDHATGEWTDEHTHFYEDGPMA